VNAVGCGFKLNPEPGGSCRNHLALLEASVEKHEGEPEQKTGYSLDVFNAIGDTIAVLVVEESKIELVKRNEILHVRRLDKVGVL
jgi:hypothetical protein